MAAAAVTSSSSSSSSSGWYYHNFYTVSSSCQSESLGYVWGYHMGTCRQTYDEHHQPAGSLMYRHDESIGYVYAMEFSDLKCREPRTKWMKELRRFAEVETAMPLPTCESIEEGKELYGLPGGDHHAVAASRSVKITKQQRLPLSGEYVVQLGFDKS